MVPAKLHVAGGNVPIIESGVLGFVETTGVCDVTGFFVLVGEATGDTRADDDGSIDDDGKAVVSGTVVCERKTTTSINIIPTAKTPNQKGFSLNIDIVSSSISSKIMSGNG